MEDGAADLDAEVLVPLELSGHKIYMSVREMGTATAGIGEEFPIAARTPRIEQVLDSLAVFAGEVAERLRGSGASRTTVEFGCELAVESGTLVAVLGRASAKTALKVALEWTDSEQ